MTTPIETRLAGLDGMAANIVAESGGQLQVALFVNEAEVEHASYERQIVDTFTPAAAYASGRAGRTRSLPVTFAANSGAITFDQVKLFASDGVTLVDQTRRTAPRTNDGPVTITLRSSSAKMEFEFLDHDAAVDGAADDTAAAARTIEAAAGYQGTALLRSGTMRVAGDQLILPTLTTLKGEGNEKAIIRALAGATGRMVQTADLDQCLEDMPKWSDGNGGAQVLPPMRVQVNNIGFHGNGSNADAPHENGLNLDGDLEYVLTGLDAYSPGFVARHLEFFKGEGTALRFNHGQVGVRPIPRHYTDSEVPQFDDIFIMNWLRGFHLESGTDAVCGYIEAAGCRDEGILVDAGASCWRETHTYGNNVGFKANSAIKAGWLHVDADVTGLLVADTAPGSIVDTLEFQLCRTVAAHLNGYTTIGQVRGHSIPTGATGILITANLGSSIGGGRIDMAANATVAFDIRQWHCDVKCLVAGDASKTGGNAQTALRFGVEGASLGTGPAPNGCDIDLTVYGANRGLHLLAIGYGNTIKIRYRDCANPIVSTLESMHASNHITLVDVTTGLEETWEPS